MLTGLVALSVGVMVVHIPARHATAWHWFHDSARLLVGDSSVDGAGGLALYRDHPEFQFGPLSAVFALPFSTFGRQVGAWLAIVVGSALGLLAIVALAAAAVRLRPDAVGPARSLSLAVGAALFVLVWGDVAVRTAHIDDAIALTATAAAVWALATGRPWGAAVLLGVAGAVKPWAIVFAPLLLAAPGGHRGLRPLLSASIVLGSWAPFVLAEPSTVDTRRFEILNEASSGLRALGVHQAMTPDWVRPAQLLGGLAVVTLLVAVGRWPAALMAGVAVRLMLDPAANRYYTVGLVLAVLLFEWVERPGRLPWLAVGAAAMLEASQLGAVAPDVGGWMRLFVVALVLATSLLYRPTRPDPLGSVRPRGGAMSLTKWRRSPTSVRP